MDGVNKDGRKNVMRIARRSLVVPPLFGRGSGTRAGVHASDGFGGIADAHRMAKDQDLMKWLRSL